MSATTEAPWLDKLDASEQRMFEEMRVEDEGPRRLPDAPEASAAPAPDDDGAAFEIDEPTPAAHREPAAAPRAAELPDRDSARIAERARLEERINILTRLAAAQPPPAPRAEEPLPDARIDPLGHFEAVIHRTGRRVEALHSAVQGVQQTQALAQFRQQALAQELAFERQQPSYRAAMAHLRQSRHEELADIGVADPAERERIIGGDVTAIADKARREGRNFAEVLYKLSERRGFRKGAAPAATQSGAAPRAADRAPKRLTPDQIAGLNDAQFAAALASLRRTGSLRDLMGH